MVFVMLANGFEEVEAVSPVDVLRRAGVPVKTVAVENPSDYLVEGAHGIKVKADELLSNIDLTDIDAIVLPGGMPGTKNLDANDEVRAALSSCADNGKLICAICAAPSVLGHLGLLSQKKATCFPGFERELGCGVFTGARVEVDGNVITADGPGSAVLFGEAIATKFVGADAAKRVVDSMKCRF